jgi:hypothetical protein
VAAAAALLLPIAALQRLRQPFSFVSIVVVVIIITTSTITPTLSEIKPNKYYLKISKNSRKK